MFLRAKTFAWFGFFQILILNKSLTQGSVLILDEPEVHLHPKWQLEYAQLIVSLVKGNIRVLVNSHSPYMIEALKRYGTQAKIQMDFYLANKEGKQSTIKDVTTNISPIFEQLSEPFDIFDIITSQVLQGG
jgi:predicted ATPase